MPPTRAPVVPGLAATLSLLIALAAFAPARAVTATGRLQIIQLDVGQGDGAVIISPLGQVVMIDDGVSGNPLPACGVKVPAQLQALGVTHVDYHFSSHYHSDHLGLFASNLFGAGGIATLDYGWDRGGSYTTSYYTNYVNTLGAKRRNMVKGQIVTLDSLSAHPVTIRCVDLNGAGVSTTDENTLSMVLKISYGEFDAVYGGDLGGANSGSYKDIESIVGPAVGPVEVAKVHHHGSATSTNANWLAATRPKVGIISVGTGNSYGHPTSAVLTRLHNANVQTYWTETGSGATPNPTWDHVSNGQIIISATWQPGGVDSIRGNGFTDTFTNSGTASDVTAPVVAVTSPDGGENWKAGSTHAVTWTATDDVGVSSVDLAYSTDGGSTFPNPIVNGIANGGSYSWTVPNAPGSAVRVRVRASDAAGNLGADSSAANLTISTWTIAASAGTGGSIAPSGSVAVSQGAGQTFTIAPGTGYHVADVLVDGSSAGAVTSYTFSDVTADHAIVASFALNPYTIAASAGANGTITPTGDVIVSHGASQSFSIRPDTGHHVLALIVDETTVAPDTTYTFTEVTAGHSIAATFSANSYALTVTTTGGGSVTVDPDRASYEYGSAVQLTAIPLEGWAFAGWSGSATGSDDTVTVLVAGAESVTATFVDVQAPAVQVTSPAGGERWELGSLQTIEWIASDNAAVDSVDVDYSLAGPAGPWLPVVHGVANTGSCSWALPEAVADSALVRVTAYDPARNAGSATSDSLFFVVSSNAGVPFGGPTALAMAPPRPNPAWDACLLRFGLPRDAQVSLAVFDVNGRLVRALENGWLPAGSHSTAWDLRSATGSRVGGGLYFVRLQAEGAAVTGRLVVIR